MNIIPSDGCVHERLTSLGIYLNFPALRILECKSVQDVACGVYPCFYINYGDHLKVASSAAALIIDSGELVPNRNFKPPDYLSGSRQREALRTLSQKLPKNLKAVLRWLSLRLLHKDPASEERWYATWETADSRVRRLHAFEQVTGDSRAMTFHPDYSLRDAELFLTRSADLLKQFVRSVETAFPEHEHIIQMGGKDSQLLSLIPKLNQERWHIFSAEPNTSLVRQWLELNKIPYGRFFAHDNCNEENGQDLAEKVLCSDLVSDPKQSKWLPKMREIARAFDHKCIFWAGTAADAIYSYHTSFHARPDDGYFALHQTRVSSLQGNYHQTFKNFVGCPLLSPYHSADIWQDLYRHYSPRLISPSTDYRDRLGEMLWGRPLIWQDQNPGPAAYEYAQNIDTFALYLSALIEHLKTA